MGVPPQHQAGGAEDAGQEIVQRFHHAAVLGEDERSIARCGNLLRKVAQAAHLAASAGS